VPNVAPCCAKAGKPDFGNRRGGFNFYHGLIGNHVHFASTVAQLGAQCGACRNPDLPYLTRDYEDLVRTAQAAGPDDQIILTAPPFDYDRGTVPLAKGTEAAWIRALYVQADQIVDEAAIAAHAAGQLRGLMESRHQIRRLRAYKRFAQTLWQDPLLHAAQDRITFVIDTC